ncbi:MAG TPA: ATP-binding protein [Bacilli bacterium]|nr:ATP-binding protein [Bacilli bacterium]
MDYIKRERYLAQLIRAKHNRLIKVITGIRRVGKSFLLDPLFTTHLIESGVKESQIIKINLDDEENKELLDAHKLSSYIRAKLISDENYYVIIDEIQKVEGFEAILNGLLYLRNVDVYVTGSNSKFLSRDIITEFRGRSHQIKVYPLSFAEFLTATQLDKREAYQEYVRYGGMPQLINLQTEQEKTKYLKDLFELTYLKDIIERNELERDDVLDAIVNMLASAVGSLTNPYKLTNTFKSHGMKELSINTVRKYIDFLIDDFLVEKVERYDVKGKKYIQNIAKYYFADVGLRNARMNFRQQEENKIMENIVYLELLRRGYNVDVGIVEVREGDARKQLEIDFVCNQSFQRYYIQVTQHLETREKTKQKSRSLLKIEDNFKKVIIVKDDILPWITEEGILVLGMMQFSLDAESLNI